MIRNPASSSDDLTAEMIRLFNKKKLVIETIGLLPGLTSGAITTGQAILELGCGSGAWTFEVARQHPEAIVTGIDRSQSMISFAQNMAGEGRLNNLHYQRKDNLAGPFDFSAASFDFISAEAPSKYLWPTHWP